MSSSEKYHDDHLRVKQCDNSTTRVPASYNYVHLVPVTALPSPLLSLPQPPEPPLTGSVPISGNCMRVSSCFRAESMAS